MGTMNTVNRPSAVGTASNTAAGTAALVEKAMCLKNAIGCEQNMDEAIRLLKEAVKQNSGEAARQLGLCYAYGAGVEQNDRFAMSCFLRGAHLGDAESMYCLFQNYTLGLGCNANSKEADAWLEKAAKAGSIKAVKTKESLSRDGMLAENLSLPRSENESAGSAGSNRSEAIFPGAGFDSASMLDKGYKPRIISPEYISPVPGGESGMILLYAAVGAVSGFLLRSIYVNDASLSGVDYLTGHFGSVGSFTLFMIIVGAVIGLIAGLLMCGGASKTKESLLLLFPLLLMPFVVLVSGTMIMAFLEFVIGFLSLLFYAAVYVLIGLSTLGSSSR
ncbi:MAG: tetratricopeptide repeat protein [Eubacteriales bacterium]|nr:tetratricopeptide repeat protein [Eubacteriales bacterium]